MNLPDQIENVIQALTHIRLHHLFVIVSERLHDTYGSRL